MFLMMRGVSTLKIGRFKTFTDNDYQRLQDPKKEMMGEMHIGTIFPRE
jgi:hypothetical protein